MHLQAVVPFMQLTWNDDDAKYCVETIVPIFTQYHLVNQSNEKLDGEQQIALVFYRSGGYDPAHDQDPDHHHEGISHFMRRFTFGNFPPPSDAGDASVTVSVTVYDFVYNPDSNPEPGAAMYKKKSKMQLADAEVGVDPTVNY